MASRGRVRGHGSMWGISDGTAPQARRSSSSAQGTRSRREARTLAVRLQPAGTPRRPAAVILDERALRLLIKDAVREAIRDERAEAGAVAGEYLPVAEASRIAHVAPETVRGWIDAGKLG